MTKLFPVVMLFCSAAAASVYAWAGNWRLATYWGCAAVMNVVLTF